MADPVNSILDSIKKVLGIAPDYDVFDPDLIQHINSVFFTLQQLGIGPEEGFEITDAETTWDAFLGTNKLLNSVKTYISLRVRILFDPPANSFVMDALQKQIQELEWRLNVYSESPVSPTTEVS